MVLDTSVLVGDPGCLDGFAGCDVVIPFTVIEELDSLKTRLDDVGRAARTALRTIEEHRVRAGGSLAQPFAIGDPAAAGTLQVEINGIQKHLLIEHGLDPNVPDNRIIGAALGQAMHAPTMMISNDAALRIKAAHLGLEAREHHPAGRRAATRHAGWVTLDATHEAIDDLYTAGAVACSLLDGVDHLQENGFAVMRNGSQSALARRVDDELVLLPHSAPEAWGLRARSKEQRFALELLLDPDVSVVALDGRAGTGKTLLAIAAGLEQVVEQRRYERLAVYRPLVPVGRADVGFLPGGLDEKLDPWMSAIHDAIVALTDQRSAHDAHPALARIGHVPARPQPAPPDRRRRRGPEPRAHHAEDRAHPHRRRHQGHLHGRHQPDRRAVPRRVEQRVGSAHPGLRRADVLRPRHAHGVRAQHRGQPGRRAPLTRPPEGG
jgi:PhoH-like ATPase